MQQLSDAFWSSKKAQLEVRNAHMDPAAGGESS
jgi:hypothetical protein